MPDIKKFTQRQIALHLCDNNPEHADNFQKRVWRPARPVIPYLVANDVILSNLGSDQKEFPVDLASTSLIGVLITLAQLLEPRVCADARFGIREAELIKFEWIP